MYCSYSLKTASDYYKELESRLKSFNDWYTLFEKVKANFTLFDANTMKVTNELKRDNFIRIDIPGLGNPNGDGYDWTKN